MLRASSVPLCSHRWERLVTYLISILDILIFIVRKREEEKRGEEEKEKEEKEENKDRRDKAM